MLFFILNGYSLYLTDKQITIKQIVQNIIKF